MFLKKLLTTITTVSLLSSVTCVAFAAIDDLEELRSGQVSKEWRLLKYDKRLNIKAYDKLDGGFNNEVRHIC